MVTLSSSLKALSFLWPKSYNPVVITAVFLYVISMEIIGLRFIPRTALHPELPCWPNRQQILAQKMLHKTSQQNDKAIAICQLILSKRASYVERSPLLHKRKKNFSDSLRRRCTHNGRTEREREREKGETEKESKFPKSLLHDTSSVLLQLPGAMLTLCAVVLMRTFNFTTNQWRKYRTCWRQIMKCPWKTKKCV